MSGTEWRALGLFALAMYALSFLSEKAAIFTILVVGVSAFVTRSTITRTAGNALSGAKG
jgi:VIT1/CCC1 family predicted Fe2+/Mn2+ transporter